MLVVVVVVIAVVVNSRGCWESGNTGGDDSGENIKH